MKSIENSELLLDNQENHPREIYDAEYAVLAEKVPFSFTYWMDKDKVRYYEEILNELEAENRKRIFWPNLLEKIVLALFISVAYYNTIPSPNVEIYNFLSKITYTLIFFITVKELWNLTNMNGCIQRISKYQYHLEPIAYSKTENYEKIAKYHKIKLRILALDSYVHLWHICIFVLDIIFNVIIVILSIYLLYVRKSAYGQKTFYSDLINIAFSSSVSSAFVAIYLKGAVDNWKWQRDVVNSML